MNIPLLVVGALFGAFVVYSWRKMRKFKKMPPVANSEKIKVLTDTNFGRQVKDGIVLVDFWAEWCVPCKMIAPVLNDLADDLENKALIAKIDVETNKLMASKYNVRSIPTLILFRNGSEVSRFVGVKSKDYLKKEIRKIT